MEFKIQAKEELIVYTYNLKQMRQLKRFGDMAYISRRMRYAVLFVNQEKLEETKQQLEKQHFVKRVVESPRAELDVWFRKQDRNEPTKEVLNAAEEEE
ncbi:hypothetical protein LOSG293_030790 [Secundilactobacillus oryzae JCM 18671]|uniref:Uncharacterized protein n=1 Tax=Secundilactobacillus oryzae JCM 18671 TaxID=1291743 RepID=A0A081BGS2_9LACO|nr:YlbG family protein [Secundilactobacillus oryzae]GAK47240.1 hypothetical protein LOSG293_030790 [Secundilactobacillus oryzae JCM 18671]